MEMKEIQIKQDKRILFEYYNIAQKDGLKKESNREIVIIKSKRALNQHAN